MRTFLKVSKDLLFSSKVDAQLLVVQKLEEKEGILQSSLATLEKELALRTQALELNKRKVRITSYMCMMSVIVCAEEICKFQCSLHSNFFSLAQAVEAAQLAEDLKVQLEHTQAKLREIQASVLENRTARERESGNLKRAQVQVKHMHTRKQKTETYYSLSYASGAVCLPGGLVKTPPKAGETEEGGDVYGCR